MHKKIYIFLLSVLFLASCTAYVDAKRQAGTIGNVGQSTEDVVALCYNPLFNHADAQRQLADEACAPKTAVFQKVIYFNCSLFYPNTAFYECRENL